MKLTEKQMEEFRSNIYHIGKRMFENRVETRVNWQNGFDYKAYIKDPNYCKDCINDLANLSMLIAKKYTEEFYNKIAEANTNDVVGLYFEPDVKYICTETGDFLRVYTRTEVSENGKKHTYKNSQRISKEDIMNNQYGVQNVFNYIFDDWFNNFLQKLPKSFYVKDIDAEFIQTAKNDEKTKVMIDALSAFAKYPSENEKINTIKDVASGVKDKTVDAISKTVSSAKSKLMKYKKSKGQDALEEEKVDATSEKAESKLDKVVFDAKTYIKKIASTKKWRDACNVSVAINEALKEIANAKIQGKMYGNKFMLESDVDFNRGFAYKSFIEREKQDAIRQSEEQSNLGSKKEKDNQEFYTLEIDDDLLKKVYEESVREEKIAKEQEVKANANVEENVAKNNEESKEDVKVQNNAKTENEAKVKQGDERQL